LSKRFSKLGWIALAALLILGLIALPACTTPPAEQEEEEEEEEEEFCSTYVGSGALDGAGIPPDFFSDLDVRKGFCYAFDYETYIRDGLQGAGEQRGSPVVEGLPYYNPDASMYEYDEDLAELHLKAAWGGEVWEKGFKFTLLYNSGNIPRKTACEILAENLAGINPLFEVSIQPISWPTFLGKIWGTRDMPMFQIGWLPDYPHPDNFIVPFMESTHGAFSHYQAYGSPELDTKIEEAFAESDPVAAQAKYYELQEIYYQDPGGIMLAQPIARRYFTDHISGFYYNPVEPNYIGRVLDLTKADSGGSVPYNNPGTFIFQTIGPIKTLDPAWIYDTASAAQTGLIYDPLLYFDGESSDEFIPQLATEWEFNSTEATFRFKIREGVKFTSGNDLTPEDVEYTFERWMVMDRPGGPTWMIFGPLLGVGASAETTIEDIMAAVEVDGDSVVFHLGGGAHWELAFLQILCGGWAGIVDKDFCIANGGWDGTAATWMDYNRPDDVGDTVLYNNPSGTGPWKLNVWEPGIQVNLQRNDDYWGGSVPFDYVITQVVEEWTSRKLALLAGDADLVYVPATYFDEMDDIEAETDLNVYKDLPSLSIDAFFFNMLICG
jgi:ABC-type transport system substrate-binding protein